MEKLFTTKERVLGVFEGTLEYTGRSPNVSRFSEMESAREKGNQEHRRNIRRTTGYFVFEQKDMDFEV